MRHDGKTLAGWFAFTLYVSAARYDADRKQLQELRDHVVPAIDGLKRRDLAPEETRRLLSIVLVRIQAIMGQSWRPQGTYMEAIDAMLGEHRVRDSDTTDRSEPSGSPSTEGPRVSGGTSDRKSGPAGGRARPRYRR